MEERPGNPDAYARIESHTDCATLQQEFDQAMALHEVNEAGTDRAVVATSYAGAADDRMRELGCYE